MYGNVLKSIFPLFLKQLFISRFESFAYGVRKASYALILVTLLTIIYLILHMHSNLVVEK